MPVAILRRLLLVSSLCAASLTQAETWPGADWSRAEAPSSAALEAFSAYAFPPRDDVSRQGIRTDALLVIRDGQIIYERYAGPTKASTLGVGCTFHVRLPLAPFFCFGGVSAYWLTALALQI